MKIIEDHIAKIADYLDSGLICFYHRPSGSIEWYPDPNNYFFEEEEWQEPIDKIENDRENYVRFEPMSSREAFRMREKFAYSLNDEQFGAKLLEGLAKRKPFRNFGWLIDDSDYRQDWFDFKKQAYCAYVREEAKMDEEE